MEHEGHRKRIRERFMNDHFDNFHPHEVLELLLTYALPRQDTNPIAHRLVDHFGSLHAVLEADIHELMEVNGIGERAATLIAMMLPLLRRYEKSKNTRNKRIRNNREMCDLCLSLFTGATQEKCFIISLNPQLELLGVDLIAEGSPNQVPITPRNVLDVLIRRKASGAVLTHNHPGGSRIPSQQDVDITGTIASILSPLDICLYDHILVVDGDAISMNANGYIRYEEDNVLPFAANRQNHVPPIKPHRK